MLISRDLRTITKCRISGPRNVSDDPGRLYHKEIKIEQYQYRDHIYVLDIYIHVCIRVEEKQSMIHDLIRICVCVCVYQCRCSLRYGSLGPGTSGSIMTCDISIKKQQSGDERYNVSHGIFVG